MPPNSRPDQISPRGAVLMALLAIACGIPPILVGLRVIGAGPAPDVAPWVVVASGAMFVLAGLAIINGYALWGAPTADGDLPASAPFAAKVAQYLLGTSIIGLMFAVFAWIAFGPGQRRFSTSMSFGGAATSAQSSAHTGRIVFGVGAVLIGLFFVTAAVSGAKRLVRTSAIRGTR